MRPIGAWGLAAIALAILAGCGTPEEDVEAAVRIAAEQALRDEGARADLAVVGVDCLRTMPIQEDVDQYFCDIRVEDERGAGFVDHDSEVFYSTSTGRARLLEFPPGRTAG